MGDGPQPTTDPVQALAAEVAALGDSSTIPEIVQALADWAPSMTSANVLYGYGMTLSLAFTDVADVLSDAVPAPAPDEAPGPRR